MKSFLSEKIFTVDELLLSQLMSFFLTSSRVFFSFFFGVSRWQWGRTVDATPIFLRPFLTVFSSMLSSLAILRKEVVGEFSNLVLGMSSLSGVSFLLAGEPLDLCDKSLPSFSFSLMFKTMALVTSVMSMMMLMSTSAWSKSALFFCLLHRNYSANVDKQGLIWKLKFGTFKCIIS